MATVHDQTAPKLKNDLENEDSDNVQQVKEEKEEVAKQTNGIETETTEAKTVKNETPAKGNDQVEEEEAGDDDYDEEEEEEIIIEEVEENDEEEVEDAAEKKDEPKIVVEPATPTENTMALLTENKTNDENKEVDTQETLPPDVKKTEEPVSASTETDKNATVVTPTAAKGTMSNAQEEIGPEANDVVDCVQQQNQHKGEVKKEEEAEKQINKEEILQSLKDESQQSTLPSSAKIGTDQQQQPQQQQPQQQQQQQPQQQPPQQRQITIQHDVNVGTVPEKQQPQKPQPLQQQHFVSEPIMQQKPKQQHPQTPLAHTYQPQQQPQQQPQPQQQQQQEYLYKPQHFHQRSQQFVENQTQFYETEESSTNGSKLIDLQKIFTPATDAEDILPKNRKLYASSAFYTPGLHPTVEDQVELARRISHSLSDISNQQSKGQSMYVNRKKRSVKWVHEGHGQDFQPQPGSAGARPLATSPSLLPAYSEAGKHRVQLNMHQEQLLQKYVKPELRVVKTPWEAALETGSASTAFVERPKASPTPGHQEPAPEYLNINNNSSLNTAYNNNNNNNNINTNFNYNKYEPVKQEQHVTSQQQYSEPPAAPKPVSKVFNYQRDLAYKPNVAQGWKSANVSLPTNLYVPKEIPLESYAPPPPLPTVLANTAPYVDRRRAASTPWSNTSYAEVEKPSVAYGNAAQPAWSPPLITQNVPPKQQYFPADSYQKVPQVPAAHLAPQLNFQPSPLPQTKLAKFEQYEASPQPHTTFPVQRPSVPYNVGSYNQAPTSFPKRNLASSPSRFGGQNFNNSARGWQTKTGARGMQASISKPATPAAFYNRNTQENWASSPLPYTDF